VRSRKQPDNVLRLALDNQVLSLLDGLADCAGTTTTDLLRTWINEWLWGNEVSGSATGTSEDLIEVDLAAAISPHRVILLCKFDDPEGSERTVEPHVLYESMNGDRLLSVYQTDGYSASDELPGWRNISIDDIRWLSVLDRTFEPRWGEGYNPDSERYAKVLHRA
jgi:hypothetical protein